MKIIYLAPPRPINYIKTILPIAQGKIKNELNTERGAKVDSPESQILEIK